MNFWKISNNLYNLFFNRLYRFEGRSSRKEYIARLLLTTTVFVTWGYTVDYVPNTGLFAFVYIFSMLFSMIIMFFQYIPLAVRRLHDLNENGWYVLITFLPFGQLLILWLIFREGTTTTNKYGEPPTN